MKSLPRKPLLFLIALAFTGSLAAQSFLIPVDAPNNKYPITFTDNAQQTLILNFDRLITNPGTSAGWTITVGGVPIPMVGSPSSAGSSLRITLSSSISYANRNSVLVSYNPAVGTMELTGPVEPNFTNVAGVNNHIGVQGDFINGLYGENPPVDICAAVENVEITSNIIVATRFRNSIHFRTPRMYTMWMYPAGTPKTDPNYIETGGAGSGVFSCTQNYATYPSNTDNCTWVISVYPFVLGVAPQPILSVTNNQIFITIPNYKKDDGTPAPGTGDLAIDPPIGDPRTLFCVGEDIPGFIFRDATAFDCRLDVEPDLPNIRVRNAQFVYGTHSAAGIPNVYIDVYGTMVQVTDANGVGIQGVWHVNPDGTPNGPGYTTPSGYFEGPVQQYSFDPATKLLISPMAETYPIYHDGNFATDVVDDIFQVTLRNWGPCNPYDAGDPFTYLNAVTDYSYLRLIASPPPPVSPDPINCFGSVTDPITVGNSGGIVRWYSDPDTLNLIYTGASYTHGQSAVNTYYWWVTEKANTSEGCVSDTTRVTLVINPLPDITLPVSDPVICAGANATITVTGSKSGTSYQLRLNSNNNPVGAPVNGTGGDITFSVSPGATTVYNVLATIIATGCQAQLTDLSTVTVNPLPTVNVGPALAAICQGATTGNLGGSFGGGATAAVWSDGGAGGSFINNGGTTPNTARYTASLTAPATVTLTLTTSGGSCGTASASKPLTVNPLPTVNVGGAIPAICQGGTTIGLGGSVGGGATGGTWSTTAGGTFSPAATNLNATWTPPAAYSGTATLRLTTSGGSCGTTFATKTVTVNPLPTVNVGPAIPAICQGGTTIGLGGSVGGGATGGTWSTPAGGTFNPSATTLNATWTPPAAYTGTATLTLTTSGGLCGTTSANKTVTVNVLPTVDAGGAVAAICQGGTTGPLGGSFGGSATAAVWSDGGAGGSFTNNGGATPNTATYTASLTAPASVTLTLTTSGGSCGTASASKNLTVNPLPNLIITNPPSVCAPATVDLTAPSVTAGSTPGLTLTYWTDAGATISYPTPAAAAAGTYYIKGTVGATGCYSIKPVTAVINPAAPAVPSINGVSPVCQSQTGVVYWVTNDPTVTSYSWNFAPALNVSPVGPINQNSITVDFSASSASGNVTVTASNGCGNLGPSAPFAITVNVAPTVNAGPAMADICQGGTTAGLGGSVGGGATGGTWSTPAGGTFTPGASTLNATWTPPPAYTGTATLTLTTTGGTCGTTSASKTVTVNPLPTVNAGGAIAAICQGATTGALGGSFGGGATAAVWSDGGAGGSFANNGGATPGSATYTASPTAPASVTLTLTTSGGSCGTTSASKVLTVNPLPTVNAGGAMAAICQGATSAALGGSFGGGATAAVWSDGGAGGSFTNNGGATPNTATYTASLTAPASVTLTLTTSGGSCGTTSASKTITVNPLPTVNAGGAMAAICQGATSAALGGSFAGSATGAVWSDGGAGGTFANNSGATPNTATYTASLTAPATVTLTLTSTGGPCGTATASKTITVNPLPTVNVGGAMAAICQGATSAALGGSFGGGATAAVWSDGGAGGSFANNGGATPNTATYTASLTAPASVTLTLTTSGGSCGITSASKTITVNPLPTVNAGVAVAAICQGATSAALGGSFGGSATAAVWSDGGAGGSFTNNGGATPNLTTYTASPAAPASVTLTLTTSGGPCGTTSASKTITVNPLPTVNAGGAIAAICQGATTGALGGSFGGGATAAVWSDGGAGGSFANNGGATPGSATYTASPTAPASVTLTLTTSGGSCGTTSASKVLTVNPLPTVNAGGAMAAICQGATSAALGGSFGGGATAAVWSDGGAGGSFTNNGGATPNITTYTASLTAPASVTLTLTTSGGSCGTTSASKTITVNPLPTVNAGGAMAAICQGATSAALGGSFGGSATGAVWSDGGAGGTFANNGGATPNTATYTASLTAPATVTLTLTSTGGPCGTATASKTITVNPLPTVTVGGAMAAICQGATSAALGGSFGGGATAAVWSDGGAGGSFANNSGATPNTATYTASPSAPGVVTLTLTTSGGSCGTTSASKPLTVNPLPTVNVGPAVAAVCQGGTSGPLGGSFGGSATAAVWSDGAAGGTFANNDGSTPDLATYTASLTAPASVTLTLTTSGGPCGITSANKSITVNPLPVTPDITGPSLLCENEKDKVYQISPNNPASTYNWTVPPILTQTSPAGLYFIIVNAVPGSPGSGNIQVVETITATGCSGTPKIFPVTVSPIIPGSNVTGANSVCANSTGVKYSVPDNPGSTYTWTLPPGASITTVPPTLHEIDVSFSSAVTGLVSVTESNGFCTTVHTPLSVTVNPIPASSIVPDKIFICMGEAVTFTAGPGGQSNYEFFVDGVSAQSGASNTFVTTSLTNGQQVYVVVTSPAGCSNPSAPVTINVFDNPVVALTSSDADNIICSGTSVIFTANSPTSVSYEFFKNGISVQNGPLPTYTTNTLVNNDAIYAIGSNFLTCKGTSNTITTTVNPLPSGVLSGDNIICPGASTNIQVAVTTGTAPYTVEISNGIGPINGYASNDPISVSPFTTTIYSIVSLTDANSCTVMAPHGNLTGTATINLHENISITAQPVISPVCEGTALNISINAQGSGLSINWQEDSGSGFGNLVDIAGTYSGTSTNTLNILNPASAMNGYRYRAYVSGICPPAIYSDTVTLTVYEKPEVVTPPSSTAVCEGDNVEFIVDEGVTTNPAFQWQIFNGSSWVSVTGGQYNGITDDTLIITGVSGSLNNNQYRAVVSGTCSPSVPSAPATLTVNERPEISLQPADVTVCEGLSASFTIATGVTTNPSVQWQVFDGSLWSDASVAPYSGGTTLSLTANPLSSSMNGYRFRAIVSGTCSPEDTSNVVTLTVHELPEVTDPASVTSCEGDTVFFEISTGVTTNPSIQWQISVDGISWNNVSGAVYSGINSTRLNINGISTPLNNMFYRAVVTGACPVPAYSATATLNVKEKPEVTTQPVSTPVCEGGSINYTISTGVTTNPSVIWEVFDGSNWNTASGVPYSGTNTLTLSVNPVVSAMNNFRYRAMVQGDCTPSVYSDEAVLSVLESPEVIVHPRDTTVCEGRNLSFTVNSGATAGAAFVWQVDPNTGSFVNATGAPYSGENTATLIVNPADSAMNGYRFRAVVSGTCPAPVQSNAATLFINQKPEILADPVNVTVCEDGSAVFNVNAGVTTSPDYLWEVNDGGSWFSANGVKYSGQGTNTLTVNNITSAMSGYLYRAVVGGTCTPNVTSGAASLTVDEKPEILDHPQDETICEGENTSFSVDPGLTTSPLYTWEVFNGTLWAPASGGVYSGETTAILNLTNVPSSMNGYRYRVTVQGSCVPAVTSNVAILTVNERPDITADPVDVISCEGDTVSYKISVITTNPVYRWQVFNGTSWLNVSGIKYSGGTSDSLVINGVTSTMNNYRYRAIVSGTCSPNDTSLEASLEVREKPEIIIQPVSSVICEGTPVKFFVNAGVTTSPAYLWEVDPGTGFVPASIANHSGYTTDTLSIIAALSGMNGNDYRVTVSGICSPSLTSNVVTLTVNELPEVISSPDDTTVCEGANIALNVNAGVTTNPSYQWKMFNGVAWSDLAEGGNYLGTTTPTLNLLNIDSAMTNYRFKAAISGTCLPSVESSEATLIVNTAPFITKNPSDTTVCESEAVTFTVNAVGTAITYRWQVNMNDGAGFNNISDTAGIYSGTATNVLSVINPVRRFNNYQYRAVVSGTCLPPRTSAYAVLRINNPPEILTQPVPLTICEFSNASFSVSAQGANLSYTWQESQGGPFADLNDAGNYIGTKTQTMSIFNVPRTMNTWRYQVLIQGICGTPVTSGQVELTVNTSPVVTAHPVDSTICEGNGATFSVTAEGTNLDYEWQVSSGGPFTPLADDTTYTGTNTNQLQITDAEVNINGYQYRVRVSGACLPAVFSDPALLYVNKNPVITVNPVDEEICENGLVNFITAATGPSLVYTWQVSTDGGGTWTDLSDDLNYSGTSSPNLTISGTPVSFNNYRYRVNVGSACIAVPSAAAVLTVNANPTPAIIGDGSFPLVCGGSEMQLNGNPTGGSGSYTTHSWTGDIIPLDAFNIQQPVFSSMINGIYNLIYTVTDSKGCKGADTVAINNDRPNSQFTSDAVPACGVLTVNFTNTSTRAVSYIWDYDDGGPTDNTVNAVHQFENIDPSGLVKYFNVNLIAISANNCRDTSNQYITIYPKVDPVFTVTPDSGCQPVIVTMITQPGAASYSWDFGDGQQQMAGYTVLHEFVNLTNNIQNYNVTLTTTSFYGCKASSGKTVKVYPIPQPNFSVTPIVQTYPSATINITNLVPAGPWTFEYHFGDGNSSTLPEPGHTYADPGTYKILQIVSTGTCADSVEQTVIINPALPVASFVTPPNGCTPHEIQFVNNSVYATSYIWDFGDGSISTKRDPVYTYYEPGTYSVTLTVSGPGGTDSHKVTIQVYATPRLEFSNFPDSVYVNDKPVKFFNLSGYATNYAWNFGDYDEHSSDVGDDNTSSEFEPAHIYHYEGWKDVTLIGWNDNCRDTLIIENAVLVRPAGRLTFPTVFRPNPDGPSGGRYSKDNPASNNSVFFPGIIDQVLEYHLYIYTRWGVQVFQSNDVLIGWDGYINGQLAKQGVYVWKVKGKYTNGKNFVEAGDVTLLH